MSWLATIALTSIAIPALAYEMQNGNRFDESSENERPFAVWLQDLDNRLCNKVGRVLHFVPGFRASCNQGAPERKPTAAPSLLETRVDSWKLQEEKEGYDRLAGSLRKETTEKERKQRKILVLASQLRRAKQESARIKFESVLQKRKAVELRSELLTMNAELQRSNEQLETTLSNRQTACSFSGELFSCSVPLPTVLAMAVIVGLALIFVLLRLRRPEGKDTSIEKEMRERTAELEQKISQMRLKESGVDSEVACDAEQDTSSESNSDFSWHISEKMVGKERLRCIKIKCPGVTHNDVLVDVTFNGCVVSLERKPSLGVGATMWIQPFQFKAADGLFDLKDDQVTLEGGFLTLVFRAFRGRVFHFPKHFDMSSADVDDAWLYADDCDAATAVKPDSSHPLARASHALRLAAAPHCITATPSQVFNGDAAAAAISAPSSAASSSSDPEEDDDVSSHRSSQAF